MSSTGDAASKIAKLLGETIIHHAPFSAEINERTRRKITDEWIDGLEEHTAPLIGPFLQHVLEATNAPPEVRAFLAEGIGPTQAFSGILTQIFAYGVANQILTAGLTPYMASLLQDSWSHGVAEGTGLPISPADIATGVIRGIVPGTVSDVPIPEWAAPEAAKSGTSHEQMQYLADITGMPPDATSLFEMIRRGIIDEAQLTEALKQSDLRDQWIPSFSKVRYITLTPADIVRATVQSQMVDVAMPEGVTSEVGTPPPGAGPGYAAGAAWAQALGLEPPGWVNGNPDWFRILYDTYGRPPGPVEMGRAANRGFIPWEGQGPEELSFAQAISESDVKDKYIPLLKKLAVYYPPNGEIKTMVMHGAITDEQAIALWQANGVTLEIANAYLYLAKTERITQEKAIAKGDILSMVKEQILDDAQATELLADVGYRGDDAALLIKMAHYQYSLEVLRRTVGRISTLYVQHKVDDAAARSALGQVGLANDAIDSLMQSLSAERAAAVIVPTGSQVASAMYYKVIDQETAMQLLEDLGYEPWTAWFTLSTRMHGPLPNEPTEGKPSSQPTAAGIAERQYQAAVASAKTLYDLSVNAAKSEFLDITPPNQAGYDATVAAAKTTYDQAVAQAQAALTAAGG